MGAFSFSSYITVRGAQRNLIFRRERGLSRLSQQRVCRAFLRIYARPRQLFPVLSAVFGAAKAAFDFYETCNSRGDKEFSVVALARRALGAALSLAISFALKVRAQHTHDCLSELFVQARKKCCRPMTGMFSARGELPSRLFSCDNLLDLVMVPFILY